MRVVSFSQGLLLGEKSEVVKEARDRFGVPNPPFLHHFFEFFPSIRTNLDFLVIFRLRLTGSQALRQQDIHAFFEKTWCGEDVQEDFEPFGAIPRLFNEFACRPFPGAFTIVYAARHQFPEILSSCVAILANEDDAAVVKYW